MQTYRYKIAEAGGRVEEGILKASSRSDAALQIKRTNWFIISLHVDKPLRLFSLGNTKSPRLSPMERIIFTDHLASMMSSGTPMIDALESYVEDEKSSVESIVSDVVSSLKQGTKLSVAMSKIPKVFPAFYTSLIAAGELSGRLDETLNYLASELRREHEFKERIKSALAYPILVIAVAFIVVSLLVFLVIPKLTDLVKNLGGEVPVATKIVFAAADFLLHFGPLLLILCILGIAALIVAVRQPRFKRAIDTRLLSVPLIGDVIKKYILARLLRILGSSLKYGITLPAAIDGAAAVVGNQKYHDALERIVKKILQGQSLSAASSSEGESYFPKTVIRTMKGAEKTGTVDIALLRLSAFYESEVDRLLKRVTDLIEPLLVIFLGVVVGGIALAVVLPIYQLTGRIK